MDASTLIATLKAHASETNRAGMARFGINTENALGVPIPLLRSLAKQAKKDHVLAAALWNSAIHEARILASLVDDPAQVTPGQMNRWARDFDSWDVCDQTCQNLFRFTPHAFAQAAKWASAKQEFVRRAGFALMAGLAVKARDASDEQFEAFLPLIETAASDDRNMVKKAVNWALRQIGKRNRRLLESAIGCAGRIREQDSRTARWVAADALREFRTKMAQPERPAVRKRRVK